ncbi:hypothetical protein BKA67DRAFT_256064 [Truncatella angustata]|uniref:Uncharacterized protein n=1 Tax=Truncatella angustata TaxID=152316 RepID=A0A9P8UPT8_9PEZI|nr:uncharacterized protein BKA67DRAFT_256064 [Truncatella angustata]KAH6656133.1 hypothetical protein BKA67DRAFT_256064 [Truncatella angustata]
MVPSYRYGSAGRTSVYVDPEASNYSYGNLVHRPAVSHDLPTLSLSGQYPSSSKSSACHSSDVGYTGLNSTFDTYGSATLPSNVSARSAHPDAGTYQSTAGAAGAAGDGVDNTEHPSYRSAHESDSYIYSDRLDNRRDLRTSGSTGAGSVLSNGQIYIPETQSHASAHGYSISATNTAAAGATVQPGGIEGATTAVGAGGGCVTSQVQAAGHRRSAGNLRGA